MYNMQSGGLKGQRRPKLSIAATHRSKPGLTASKLKDFPLT